MLFRFDSYLLIWYLFFFSFVSYISIRTFSGLFSSLLRLLATHFPHLSLVEDWLEDEDTSLTFVSTKVISEESLAEGKLLSDENSIQLLLRVTFLINL